MPWLPTEIMMVIRNAVAEISKQIRNKQAIKGGLFSILCQHSKRMPTEIDIKRAGFSHILQYPLLCPDGLIFEYQIVCAAVSATYVLKLDLAIVLLMMMSNRPQVFKVIRRSKRC